MIRGIRLKVCGITSLVDADAADAVGADYLGFIFHPKSPRFVSLEQFVAMAPRLPPRKRVAVCVEPAPVDLTRLAELGFHHYQIHFRHDEAREHVAAWSRAVGPSRLWLAPKLPPENDVPSDLLTYAKTFLLDTFHPDKFGGTGQTGDWAKFRRQREAHPRTTWILSGGLTPENIAAAVKATGATFVDVNSGVELAPGVKDPAKLKALIAALGAGSG